MRKILAVLLAMSLITVSGCKKKKKATDELFMYGEREYFEPFKSAKTSYCTLNEGVVLPAQTQGYSGCFACSALTSMQAYLQKTKKGNIDAVGKDIFCRMYRPGTDLDTGDEGCFAMIGQWDEYGANPLMVCAAVDDVPLDGYYMTGVNRINNPTVDQLKTWVKEYGAPVVTVHYNAGLSDYHGYPTQYYKDVEPNHFLCVIGWDDTFPKEGFVGTASQDGAWLVKNSIVSQANVPEYYWISYDVGFSLAVTYEASNEYSYVANNGYALSAFFDIGTGEEEVSYATIYRHEGELASVGVFVEEACEYTIEILDGEFGEVLTSVDRSELYSGYHVVKLDKPVPVDTCTIVIHQRGSDTVVFEGESATVETFRYITGASAGGKIEYVVNTEPNTSFVFVDGQWVDVMDDSLVEKLGLGDEISHIGDPFLAALYK